MVHWLTGGRYFRHEQVVNQLTGLAAGELSGWEDPVLVMTEPIKEQQNLQVPRESQDNLSFCICHVSSGHRLDTRYK